MSKDQKTEECTPEEFEAFVMTNWRALADILLKNEEVQDEKK